MEADSRVISNKTKSKDLVASNGKMEATTRVVSLTEFSKGTASIYSQSWRRLTTAASRQALWRARVKKSGEMVLSTQAHS